MPVETSIGPSKGRKSNARPKTAASLATWPTSPWDRAPDALRLARRAGRVDEQPARPAVGGRGAGVRGAGLGEARHPGDRALREHGHAQAVAVETVQQLPEAGVDDEHTGFGVLEDRRQLVRREVRV